MDLDDAFYGEYLRKIEEGKDELGEFTIYVREYEHPCNCHPETCGHISETMWSSQKIKQYTNGKYFYIT